MSRHALMWAACAAVVGGLAMAAEGPPAGGPGGPGGAGNPNDQVKGGMPAPAKVIATHVHMQASSSLFKKWPSGGNTWHYGEGYIEPLGQASYFCGENFPEAKDHPLPEWGKGMMQALTGRADGLFCIYTTSEGSFYVYDSVAGTRAQFADGGQNQMVNVIIDGTGPYKGATGLWLGLTEGRGTMTEVIPGRRLPAVLMKVMDGYVKLPIAAGAPAAAGGAPAAGPAPQGAGGPPPAR